MSVQSNVPDVSPQGSGGGIVTGGVVFGDATNLPTTNANAFFWDSVHLTLKVNSATINAPGSGNIFIGSGTGNFSLTGSSNVGLGNGVFAALTSGVNNTGVGQTALTNLTTGQHNVAVGWDAGAFIVGGNNNTIVGWQAMGLQAGVNANQCTAIGTSALQAVTGDYNTAVGFQAGGAVTSGLHNTCMGGGTFQANTTGSDNTVIGFNAMNLGTGDQNTLIGSNVCDALTTGSYNTGVGYNALTGITSGIRNTAIGYQALNTIATTNDSCAMGWNALFFDVGGSNVGIGKQALYNNAGGTLNVGLGISAGATNTTGTEIVCLGTIADVGSNNLTNAIAIGYGAVVMASNSMMLGNASLTLVQCNTDGGVNFGTASTRFGSLFIKTNVQGTNGSAGAPVYTFGTAQNYGIYSLGQDATAISVSGVGGYLFTGSQFQLASGQNLAWSSGAINSVSDVKLKRTGAKAFMILDDATASLGFFNTTPAAQQTQHANTAYADAGANVVHSAGTFTGGVGATAYTIGDVVAALKNYGLLVS